MGGMAGEDLRVSWILQYIHEVFSDIPEQLIKIYNRDNRQQLAKYLDDKVVFKSLFFQNITTQNRKKEFWNKLKYLFKRAS